jgi:DNA-binding transcriptional LysR family regulator
VPVHSSPKGAQVPRPGLELNQLRYFQTVARCGSLTQAARLLKVSQPTLTVAIRNLEERLGTTLLLRDRSGVQLSSTGQELLRACDELFTLLERTEQRIQGMETEEAGSFVVGCHESLGAYFLPRLMRDLLRDAPRIEISLWNGTSAAVRQAVIDREVHFGLSVNPLPHPDLVLVELFKDAVDIFIARELAPAQEVLAAAQELIRRGPLIYAGRVSQCQELIGRLAAEALLPVRMLSCGDLELVKSLALQGLGVALLPRRVAAYGHEGRLVRLHPALPFIPDTIYLLYRADLHRTRAALRLKEAIVAYGRRLDEVK